jgi:hypothetical protein
MPTHDARREARQSRRCAPKASPKVALKKTPADYLGEGLRPITGEIPPEALACSRCLALFRDRATFDAHRVNAYLPIERCATATEMTALAAFLKRSAAGVWRLALTIACQDAVNTVRMNLDRLAPARAERGAWELRGTVPGSAGEAMPLHDHVAVEKGADRNTLGNTGNAVTDTYPATLTPPSARGDRNTLEFPRNAAAVLATEGTAPSALAQPTSI